MKGDWVSTLIVIHIMLKLAHIVKYTVKVASKSQEEDGPFALGDSIGDSFSF